MQQRRQQHRKQEHCTKRVSELNITHYITVRDSSSSPFLSLILPFSPFSPFPSFPFSLSLTAKQEALPNKPSVNRTRSLIGQDRERVKPMALPAFTPPLYPQLPMLKPFGKYIYLRIICGSFEFAREKQQIARGDISKWRHFSCVSSRVETAEIFFPISPRPGPAPERVV